MTYDDARHEPKIIDTRLPLTWLLSTAGAIIMSMAWLLWSVGMQNAKLEQLIVQSSKLEKRLDDRDARTDQIMQMIYDIRQTDDSQNLRLNDLERRMNDSKQGK